MVWQDWQCFAAWTSSNSFRAELKITKWSSAWKKTQANPCVGKEFETKRQKQEETWKTSVLKKAEEWVALRSCPLNQTRAFNCAHWNYSNWNMTGMLWLELLHLANKLVIAQLLMMRSHWSLSFCAFAKIFHTLLTFSMADMKHHILWFRKCVNSVRVADCSFSSFLPPRRSDPVPQFCFWRHQHWALRVCVFVMNK